MNNKVSASNRNQSLKSPTLRDVMTGKKVVRKLPDNFFEKVIEEELALKRHFSLETLQSLVDLYSVY